MLPIEKNQHMKKYKNVIFWKTFLYEKDTPPKSFFIKRENRKTKEGCIHTWNCRFCSFKIRKVIDNKDLPTWQKSLSDEHLCEKNNVEEIKENLNLEVEKIMKIGINSPTEIYSILKKENNKLNINQIYYEKRKIKKANNQPSEIYNSDIYSTLKKCQETFFTTLKNLHFS